MLTEQTLWEIREQAARSDSEEAVSLSRLCSTALWSKSDSQRRRANKAVAVLVATEGM